MICIFNLAENLAFTDNQGVQTGGNAEQMLDAVRTVQIIKYSL